jgi:hypothetical protein
MHVMENIKLYIIDFPLWTLYAGILLPGRSQSWPPLRIWRGPAQVGPGQDRMELLAQDSDRMELLAQSGTLDHAAEIQSGHSGCRLRSKNSKGGMAYPAQPKNNPGMVFIGSPAHTVFNFSNKFFESAP